MIDKDALAAAIEEFYTWTNRGGASLYDPIMVAAARERLAQFDAEAIERAAEALYDWDEDSGSSLISWRFEGESPNRERTRDYYRRGVQAVLDAFGGETP